MKDIIDNTKYLLSVLKKMDSRKVLDIDLTYAISMTEAITRMLDQERSKINDPDRHPLLKNWVGDDE